MGQDELKRKVRFKLTRDKHNWTVRRSYVSKGDKDKLPKEKWRIESHHPRLKFALKHMLDRLESEGYKPKGLEALVARVEEAEARVLAFCEERMEDAGAELETIP